MSYKREPTPTPDDASSPPPHCKRQHVAMSEGSFLSAAAIDMRIHTLVPRTETIGCVRVQVLPPHLQPAPMKKGRQSKPIPPSEEEKEEEEEDPPSPSSAPPRQTMAATTLDRKRVSLILLADVSASMCNGTRMQNMHQGIARLGELSRRMEASMAAELTIIAFNQTPSTIYSTGPVPSDEALRDLCSRELVPHGGTNIGAAIEAALEIAAAEPCVRAAREKEEEGGRTGQTTATSVHLVLFTDGGDSERLSHRMDSRAENDPVNGLIERLRTLPRLTVHCVGICADADAELLGKIAAVSRRGTFQCIKDTGIGALMGGMYGLMKEMVDENVRLLVEITDDGCAQTAVVSRDIFLRLCDPPMPTVVGFKVSCAPATAEGGRTMIRARLIIGDDGRRCLDARLALPRPATAAAGGQLDLVCAEEALNLALGELSAKIAALVRADATADALVEIDATQQTFEELRRAMPDQAADAPAERHAACAAAIEAAMRELEGMRAELGRAADSAQGARETELRALSYASTARNSGVSLSDNSTTGGSRSISQLQRELSAAPDDSSV